MGKYQHQPAATGFDSETQRVSLLWTGGWDSTFRLLVLLLHEHRTVQPYYLIDRLDYRPSVPAEKDAMRRIRELLQDRHPMAARRLLPTIEFAVIDVPQNSEIKRHYEGCLKRGFIGGQYEWLASYCESLGIDAMELAIHRDDQARNLLEELIDASRTKLDPRFDGDSRYELFKSFRFPVFDKTKQQMRAECSSGGFDEFMKLTWFCHRPRNNQPCGVCNPCIYTIKEGLGDRVPLAGRMRDHFRVMPRLRHWLTRHPDLYLAIRSYYRWLRPRAF